MKERVRFETAPLLVVGTLAGLAIGVVAARDASGEPGARHTEHKLFLMRSLL